MSEPTPCLPPHASHGAHVKHVMCMCMCCACHATCAMCCACHVTCAMCMCMYDLFRLPASGRARGARDLAPPPQRRQRGLAPRAIVRRRRTQPPPFEGSPFGARTPACSCVEGPPCTVTRGHCRLGGSRAAAAALRIPGFSPGCSASAKRLPTRRLNLCQHGARSHDAAHPNAQRHASRSLLPGVPACAAPPSAAPRALSGHGHPSNDRCAVHRAIRAIRAF